MPPKPKITRDMIIRAGFELTRESGMESLNVRTVSQRLGCSTQPIMYHFKRIEALKKAVYQQADHYHTACMMDVSGPNPMLEMGLSYIRFAQREKHLFRLLFQSNEFAGKSLSQLTDAGELAPILAVLSEAAGVTAAQAKTIFHSLFLFVHGYASMFANNALAYDEEAIAADLARIFAGAVYASKEELP